MDCQDRNDANQPDFPDALQEQVSSQYIMLWIESDLRKVGFSTICHFLLVELVPGQALAKGEGDGDSPPP